PGDRVEEGAAELLGDRRRCSVPVDDLRLARVEEENPDQEIDAGEDQGIDDTVLPTHSRAPVRLTRITCIHRTSFLPRSTPVMACSSLALRPFSIKRTVFQGRVHRTFSCRLGLPSSGCVSMAPTHWRKLTELGWSGVCRRPGNPAPARFALVWP